MREGRRFPCAPCGSRQVLGGGTEGRTPILHVRGSRFEACNPGKLLGVSRLTWERLREFLHGCGGT